jgi:hypothetical protein
VRKGRKGEWERRGIAQLAVAVCDLGRSLRAEAALLFESPTPNLPPKPLSPQSLTLCPLKVLPHLGASTEEAEDNSAAMGADTIMNFLATGAVRNSINFPETKLEKLNR